MNLDVILQWARDAGYEFDFHGNGEEDVKGFCSLNKAECNKLVWIKNQPKYDAATERIKSVNIAVVQTEVSTEIPNVIISSKSKELYFAILHQFWGAKNKPGIGEGTVTLGNVMIDPTASIGCNCSIIGNITIGANTVIENNIVITGNVSIGDNCHIQSLTVIGIDGFGYTKNQNTGEKTMVEHFGGVKIGNDVFIGSHVNIARGTIDDTVIEDGVKIAPSTHVGHNNHVGANATLICSKLFGSVETGSEAYIVSSTIQNQSKVGANTVIGMGSVVTKPIPDNVVAYGIPAKVIKENDTDL